MVYALQQHFTPGFLIYNSRKPPSSYSDEQNSRADGGPVIVGC